MWVSSTQGSKSILLALLIIFLFYLVSFCIHRVVILWSFFLVFTLLFTALIRMTGVLSVVVFNYLVFQELMGYLFLLNYAASISALVLLFKLGVPPFHFWVLQFVEMLSHLSLVWFLVYHKASYLPVLVLFLGGFTTVLLFGLFLLYLQIFLVSSYRTLLALLSIESFTWFLLLLMSSGVSFVWFTILYLSVFLLSSSSLQGLNYPGLSLVLILMSYPLTLGFLFKYFSLLGLYSVFGVLSFLPLLLVYISVISSRVFIIILVLGFDVDSLPSLSSGSLYSLLLYLVLLL